MAQSLKEILERLTETQDEVYSVVGTVESVDTTTRTCVVIPVSDPDDKLYGVRLQAVQESTDGLLLTPKQGSTVVVTFLNRQTGYVALLSELEALEIVVENQKLQFDNKGLLLDSGAGTLGGVLLDLISTLRTFKLTTNTGATIAPTPDTMANLSSIETVIKSLLKTN